MIFLSIASIISVFLFVDSYFKGSFNESQPSKWGKFKSVFLLINFVLSFFYVSLLLTQGLEIQLREVNIAVDGSDGAIVIGMLLSFALHGFAIHLLLRSHQYHQITDALYTKDTAKLQKIRDEIFEIKL